MKFQRPRPFPYASTPQRVWFRLLACCLSLYVAFVAYFAGSGFLKDPASTVVSLLCAALLAMACLCCFSLLSSRIADWKGLRPRPLGKHRWLWFFLFFAVSLAVYGAALAAAWPGGVNYDASNQWRQALSGEYNNWHPVFHTLMIWLVTRLSQNYTVVVIVQILAAAAAQAYFSLVLCESGVPGGLVLMVHWLICITPGVRNPLMFVSKDSAMTIGMFLLAAFSLRMIFSRGEWLKKPGKIFLLGAVCAWCSLVRHNGLFAVAPLLICAFCLFKTCRRQSLWAALMCAALIVLVRGPLYGALDIVYPNNLTEESIGIPMTVLGDIRVRQPESLTEEATDFLNTLSTPEDWEKSYTLHSYNSIKFTYDHEYIQERTLPEIFRMAAESAAQAPRVAFEAVTGLTDLVWGIWHNGEGFMPVSNSGDLPEVSRGQGRLNAMGSRVLQILELPFKVWPIAYLTENIGVGLLLMLLATLLLMKRNGPGGLLLAFPILIYDLGTMMLLCGNDARFFQCSLALCLPYSLAMLYMPAAGGKSLCPNG